MQQGRQHVTEVRAALDAQVVGKPLDGGRAHLGDVARTAVEHRREIVVRDVPAHRVVEDLAVPRIEAAKRLG